MYCDALFANAITRPGSLLLKWSARLYYVNYYLRKLYMGIRTISNVLTGNTIYVCEERAFRSLLIMHEHCNSQVE